MFRAQLMVWRSWASKSPRIVLQTRRLHMRLHTRTMPAYWALVKTKRDQTTCRLRITVAEQPFCRPFSPTRLALKSCLQYQSSLVESIRPALQIRPRAMTTTSFKPCLALVKHRQKGLRLPLPLKLRILKTLKCHARTKPPVSMAS